MFQILRHFKKSGVHLSYVLTFIGKQLRVNDRKVVRFLRTSNNEQFLKSWDHVLDLKWLNLSWKVVLQICFCKLKVRWESNNALLVSSYYEILILFVINLLKSLIYQWILRKLDRNKLRSLNFLGLFPFFLDHSNDRPIMKTNWEFLLLIVRIDDF